jgi:hypothetical protein
MWEMADPMCGITMKKKKKKVFFFFANNSRGEGRISWWKDMKSWKKNNTVARMNEDYHTQILKHYALCKQMLNTNTSQFQNIHINLYFIS